MAALRGAFDRLVGVPARAYGSQDQGDRGGRCEQVFTLQERFSPRLASHGAEAQARLPTPVSKVMAAPYEPPLPASLFMQSSLVGVVVGRLVLVQRRERVVLDPSACRLPNVLW